MTKTIGVVAVAAIIVSFVLYAVLRPPIGRPAESRRLSHPAGFSIVVPEGWERHLIERTNGRGADSIAMLPEKAVGAPGFLKAIKLPTTPTEADLSKGNYSQGLVAGKPVWMRETEQKDTKEHTRSVIFERDGNWFEILIRRPISESLDSGAWQAYIETFRTETPRPTTFLPATLPATLP